MNHKNLSDEEFKRLTGVQKSTFKLMLKILRKAEKEKLAKGGRKPDLSMKQRLLMALEYWREYRTYFHIASNYGYSESQAFKVVKWIENTLIKDKNFALPGKKALLKSDMEYEVVMVDATECPVERPKKSKGNITLARKSVILKRRKSL
jgi:Helix-turn-helix of DDE superfamily endonuclease